MGMIGALGGIEYHAVIMRKFFSQHLIERHEPGDAIYAQRAGGTEQGQRTRALAKDLPRFIQMSRI
jgi:hypothetical protein